MAKSHPPKSADVFSPHLARKILQLCQQSHGSLPLVSIRTGRNGSLSWWGCLRWKIGYGQNAEK
jgi:hypothetical protein